MTDRVEDYPTLPTDYLPHVITRCLDKANRHQLPHRFHLNGAEVIVFPGQTAEAVNAEVQRQWQAARMSPAATTIAEDQA